MPHIAGVGVSHDGDPSPNVLGDLVSFQNFQNFPGFLCTTWSSSTACTACIVQFSSF